jgi:hypothetical protein
MMGDIINGTLYGHQCPPQEGTFVLVHGKKERRDAVINYIIKNMKRNVSINPEPEDFFIAYRSDKTPRAFVYYDVPDFLQPVNEGTWPATGKYVVLQIKDVLRDLERLNVSFIIGIDDYTKIDLRIRSKAQYKIYLTGTEQLPPLSLVPRSGLNKVGENTGIIESYDWGVFKFDKDIR